MILPATIRDVPNLSYLFAYCKKTQVEDAP